MPRSVFSDSYELLVQALTEARRAASVTQVELAARLKKPQSFVSKMERGERRLDFVELVAVVRALSLDERQFLDALLRALPPDIHI